MLFNTSVVQSSSTHVLVFFFVAWLSADTLIIFLAFSLLGFWLSGEGLVKAAKAKQQASQAAGQAANQQTSKPSSNQAANQQTSKPSKPSSPSSQDLAPGVWPSKIFDPAHAIVVEQSSSSSQSSSSQSSSSQSSSSQRSRSQSAKAKQAEGRSRETRLKSIQPSVILLSERHPVVRFCRLTSIRQHLEKFFTVLRVLNSKCSFVK